MELKEGPGVTPEQTPFVQKSVQKKTVTKMLREKGGTHWRAAVSVAVSVLAVAGMVALASTRPHFVELEESEQAEARALGLPSRIDPDHATGVDFVDRQALGSWLKDTKNLRKLDTSHAAALKQLHELSIKKRTAMKVSAPARTQQLTNTGVPALPVPGTITVPIPAGFTIQTGKKITGILDVAAPLDPDTGAAVPAIVVPNGAPGGTQKFAQSRKIKAYTDAGLGKSDMTVPRLALQEPALAARTAMLAAQVRDLLVHVMRTISASKEFYYCM